MSSSISKQHIWSHVVQKNDIYILKKSCIIFYFTNIFSQRNSSFIYIKLREINAKLTQNVN
jgi:hypothetical protein